jgi:quercetin dioxygenase-like cupin family protein
MKKGVVIDPVRDGKITMRGNADDKSLRKITWLIEEGLVDSEQFVGGLSTLEAGIKAPIHVHPDSEEINVVLEGQGNLLTDKGAEPVKVGDWQFVPKGVPHSHENTGDTPFTIIWIYSPPTKAIPTK